MTQKTLVYLIAIQLFCSCQQQEKTKSVLVNVDMPYWTMEKLENRASQNLDSTKWDLQLFHQDVESYQQYKEVFQSYPLNKSPFPAAVYDYAVSSIPFTIEKDEFVFKGVRIGEYENFENEKIIDKLTLLILTNDKNAEETTLVESRNFPYLTAQGYIKVTNNKYDWVFSSSPDGYSTLIVNMKLFDLRFGETIVIYPQKDQSFIYDQINTSPNTFNNFEEFKALILNNQRVKNQLLSENNISTIKQLP